MKFSKILIKRIYMLKTHFKYNDNINKYKVATYVKAKFVYWTSCTLNVDIIYYIIYWNIKLKAAEPINRSQEYRVT